MIPKISKVLYATDLSVNSAYAFRYALNTAEKHDAQIDILHVVEEMPSSRYAYLTDASSKSIKAQEQKKIDANVKRIKSRVKAVIHKEFKDRPQAGNRIASIQVIMGDPPAQILQTLDKLKSDILIIGTHSKGLIAQTFLGSAASKILQRIRIPVFVIPIPQETDISFRNE